MADIVQLHNRFAERLRPRQVGLVLVDCQEGPLARLGERAAALSNNLVGLARVVKAAGLPAVLLLRRGPGFGSLMPGLDGIFEQPLMVWRDAPMVWDDAESRAALRAFGRREIILAGLMPEGGAATAIAARFEGFVVDVAVDATAAGEEADHVAAARLSAAGVHLTSWVALMAELASAGVEISAGDAAALRDNLARYAAGAVRWADAELGFFSGTLSPVRRST